MVIETPLQLVGLDLGQVRCGLAVADAQSRLATPLAVVATQPISTLGLRIAQALSGRRLRALVAGLPLDQRGEEGEMAQWVRELATHVATQLQVEVIFVDERFTSVLNQPVYSSGKRMSARKVPNLDALAAAAILQSYLDSQSRAPDSTTETPPVD